jgi:hypothetical protein
LLKNVALTVTLFFSMKALVVLITCFAIAHVAYEYVYPNFATYTGVDKLLPEKRVVEAPKPELAVSKVKSEKEPKPKPKTEPKPKPKTEPKPELPKMVEKPEPQPEPATEVPKDEFIPPAFKTIAEVTNNWLSLPKSLYSKPFITQVEIPVRSNVGGTTIAVGGQFYVLSQSALMLEVGPAPGSPFKGQVHMDQTNIKSFVTEVYDKWVANQIAAARRAYEAKKFAAANPSAAKVASRSVRDDRPEKDDEGKYAILINSIKAAEVTEVSLENIKKWGDVKRVKEDGEEMWQVTILFEANTAFGKFDQDALVYVKNGVVKKWLYAGSRELIP